MKRIVVIQILALLLHACTNNAPQKQPGGGHAPPARVPLSGSTGPAHGLPATRLGATGHSRHSVNRRGPLSVSCTNRRTRAVE